MSSQGMARKPYIVVMTLAIIMPHAKILHAPVLALLRLLVYKQVLVAAMSIAGFQFYELEAFFAIKLKDIAGCGYFEWVTTYPVNDIAPG